MVVPRGRGGDGRRGATPHQCVYQEAIDDNNREDVLPPRLCTVHVGGADSGDEPDGALVGSRRGK